MADEVVEVRLKPRAHSRLGRILADVRLTPRARTQLELRARKLDAVASEAAIDAQPNVTRLRRPAPRGRR